GDEEVGGGGRNQDGGGAGDGGDRGGQSLPRAPAPGREGGRRHALATRRARGADRDRRVRMHGRARRVDAQAPRKPHVARRRATILKPFESSSSTPATRCSGWTTRRSPPSWAATASASSPPRSSAPNGRRASIWTIRCSHGSPACRRRLKRRPPGI